jgi:hypothetical protein
MTQQTQTHSWNQARETDMVDKILADIANQIAIRPHYDNYRRQVGPRVWKPEQVKVTKGAGEIGTITISWGSCL